MSSEQIISDEAYFKAASEVEDAIIVRRTKGDGHNDAFVSMREVYVFQDDAADAQVELDRAQEITDAEIDAGADVIARLINPAGIVTKTAITTAKAVLEAARKAKPQ